MHKRHENTRSSHNVEDRRPNGDSTPRRRLAGLGGDSYRSRARQVATLAGVMLSLLVIAPAAGARTVTLHYFSKQTSNTFSTPQGQPVAPNTPPAAGDVNDITGLDYAGNHKHHASKPTASDHLRCTITSFTGSAAAADCDAQVAIGGSMLLADDVTFMLSDGSAPLVVPINGGTGIYRHARGRIIATNVGNNTDFDIRVTY
jgi:hypothetical protein